MMLKQEPENRRYDGEFQMAEDNNKTPFRPSYDKV